MEIKLNIKCFGITKDILGGFSHEVSINEGETVAIFLENLQKKYPALLELPSLHVAINEDYQEPHYLIKPGDEVVLIPPVSGG